MTTVDVLLATFNGALFLEEQIDSIANQSHKNLRIIARDDGSTDHTLEILKHKRMQIDCELLILERKEGPRGVKNNFRALLESSSSDYIMFSDQDDVWLPEKVSLAVDAIKNLESRHGNNTPLLIFTDLRVVDKNLNEISDSYWRYQRLDPKIAQNWRDLAVQNVVTGCTILINRKAKEICLPFPEVDILHDHWIAVSVSKNGIIKNLDAQTILYRQHGSNVEAAKRVNFKYVLKKTVEVRRFLNKSIGLIAALNEKMTAFEIIYRKLILNALRIF